MNITVFGRHEVQYCKMKYKVCSSAVLVTLVDAQYGWYQNKDSKIYHPSLMMNIHTFSRWHGVVKHLSVKLLLKPYIKLKNTRHIKRTPLWKTYKLVLQINAGNYHMCFVHICLHNNLYPHYKTAHAKYVEVTPHDSYIY